MAHHVRKQTRALTFNVTAVADEFAPEVLYCGPTNDTSDLDGVLDTSLGSTALPAGASLVVEVLTPGSDPKDDANWLEDGTTWGGQFGGSNYAGLSIRVRAKSGGTAGPVTALMGWTA